MSTNEGLIADALYKSNPALAMMLDYGNSFKAEIREHGARVDLYRDYERGEHRAVITEQMRRMLRLPSEESGIQDFNGNYCGIVVDKMAGRLHVMEVTTGDPAIDDDWLAPLLEENDWDNLQTTTFRGAIRDADSYIMIDPQTLTWTAESAYDGYSGIVALFDPGARTPYWACKIWSEADEESINSTMRLIVYQPGSVSYWRGQEGGGEVQADNQTNDAETGAAVNLVSFPVSRVPIIHFANRYENYSEEGESEIRAAIPLQDVYNRTLHSMVMASEFAAFRMPWSIGFEIDATGIMPGAVINLTLKDANGNIINEPTAEMLEFLKAARVGMFEATDIGQYINQLDKIVREISQVTQTPLYGVTTDNGALSGEALKQLEIGLIGKVYRFQQQNTDAIKELVELTAEVQNAFRIPDMGSAPVFDAVSLTWKSPEILDQTAQIAALTSMRTQAPGLWSDDFYRAKIGGLLGMSQTEIQKEADAVNAQSQRQVLRIRMDQNNLPTRGGQVNPAQADTVPVTAQ
jgi:hypothetical protein